MQDLTTIQNPILTRVRTQNEVSPFLRLTRKRWWILLAVNIAFVVLGQTAAILLARFYYAEGGSSMFVATLVQTAGFPVVCIPLILIPLPASTSPPPDSRTKRNIILIYLSLGVLLAGNNLLYAVGLLYLSASTYSLICATELIFNAVFSYFLNSQKLTPLILNSVVILSFSAALLALNLDSDSPGGVSKWEYALGFLCTLGASAVYALLLSLMQLSFQKVLKSETFAVVMKMQIYTCLVASIVSLVGLFASGQWRTLQKEMDDFNAGPPSYFMTLVWTAISWQVCSVGVVGLIYMVSSLFSNVISTVALTAAPIASLIVFHDSMNGAKAIAMLLALWGFASYLFQNYLDDSRAMESPKPTEIDSSVTENRKESFCSVSLA
ncbi:probable purine permease 11 [Beta vulgaris subsp. vulgaris]|uniref:probable purine permease 11 n=1 Tax=Beta vulgaris subsp. vulgaris TaxID=3555 RepID=UPI0020368609|nr:probable purine permease 11 [Beta vulgaris subsp. vulgaris]